MSLAHIPWKDFPQVPVIEDKPKGPLLRMTVVEQVYHQNGEHTSSHEARFSQQLETDEYSYSNPYSRLGMAWEQLNPGFVEHVGTVVIENTTGKRNKQRIPTEEEKQELAQREILVGIKRGEVLAFARIPPKQSLRLNPTEPLYLRSASGPAEFSLYVIPK